jgi:DNA modification methylase
MGKLICGDALEVLGGLADDSVDLVFGSPPYEDCRTYGIDFNLKGQEWVDWMVKIYKECLRVCTGLVAFVVGHGKTEGFKWSATPVLLMADLQRIGINLRNPAIFHRAGISGSGSKDWLRADTEFIVCASRSGELPWSDNTSCGHKPKYSVGGAMTHRSKEGIRKNFGHVDGKSSKGEHDRLLHLEKANPGNLIHCKVGGGLMGMDEFSSQNEAPFPETLAEFFVKSFCPPKGTVLDCFCGSGTTLAVAKKTYRDWLGIDVRQSQVDLTRRRLASINPMFSEVE